MRIAIHYQGRVQGVGFRATTRDLARGLPLTGFVRNEPDGSVRLELQAEEATIAILRDRVRQTLGRYILAESAISLPDVQGEQGFLIAR